MGFAHNNDTTIPHNSNASMGFAHNNFQALAGFRIVPTTTKLFEERYTIGMGDGTR